MPVIARLPHVLYGADYNPEQWPESMWLEDARLMREAGVNLVSLGVFSWAWLEPRPGDYQFAWLDRVMDILHAHGVLVNLATATASPPPWLSARWPESLPLTKEGVRLGPGSRQHFCPSSPVYRTAAAALTRRLAERYRAHPALVLWHIGNEYGDHLTACYCEISAAAFRGWLARRYGTLDRLNEAWGTAFWSQRYSAWAEIEPPRAAPGPLNPTQQLDFHRFSSDTLLECFELERAILKEVTPDLPVTTNYTYSNKALDYWRWAASEDVVSYDSYGDPARAETGPEMARSYDLMRSLGNGRPWILMEQTPSLVNWRPYNVLKRPGQMRLWSYQAMAHGADGVMFFQWRASRAGAEKYHGAMVGHGDLARSRVWRECAALGQELTRLDGILDSTIAAQVAILLDYESWWALETDAKPSEGVRLLDQVRRYYAPLHTRNLAVDFARPDGDLSKYRLVLAPNLYLLRPGVAENLERFVTAGGTLVMSFFSGIVDQDEQILLGGYPAPLRRLLGLSVEEFDPFVPGQANSLISLDGTFACDLWADLIDLEGAEALATFGGDFYAGRPAVTRHRFGGGYAYYLGTRPQPVYMARLLECVCDEAGVTPVLDAPIGVEAVRRSGRDGSFLFLLNHNPEPASVTLPGSGTDLLTAGRLAGTIRLEPYGVMVVREDEGADHPHG